MKSKRGNGIRCSQVKAIESRSTTSQSPFTTASTGSVCAAHPVETGCRYRSAADSGGNRR